MSIREELEQIRIAAGGLLNPEDVVEFAKNPDTELHSRFQWDDSLAAHEHRLFQAREVINVQVVMLPNSNAPVRAYVSLLPDRKNGGYRPIEAVMASPKLHRAMLDQAFVALKSLQRRYKDLSELTPIFEMAEQVEAQTSKKQVKAKAGSAAQLAA